MKAAFAALIGVLLVAISACGVGAAYRVPGHQTGLPQPPIPAVPVSAPPAATRGNITLPLDPYQLSVTQTATLLTALDLLTARCMHAHGLSYVPQRVTTRQVAAEPVPFPFGAYDPREAARYGYSRANEVVTRYGHAFGRTGADCAGQAPELLMRYEQAAQQHVNLSLPGELWMAAIRRTANDSRMVQADSKWSACMAALGFHYPTPQAASSARWPAPPTRSEIATAVADASCKQRVNLPGIWLAIQAGYERELIARNLAGLEKVQKFLVAGVIRARQAIAGHAP